MFPRSTALTAACLALVLTSSCTAETPDDDASQPDFGPTAEADLPAPGEPDAASAEPQRSQGSQRSEQAEPSESGEPKGTAETEDPDSAGDAPRLERVAGITDPELEELIGEFAAERSGDFSVSLVELDGNQRRADYHSGEPVTSASTYKLFTAYSALLRVDDGIFSWDQMTTVENDAGDPQDIGTCFTRMLAESDNDCAAWLNEMMGRIPVQNEAHSLGADSFRFNILDSAITAADLTNTLALLEDGSLPASAAGRQRMLEAMETNIWREGIPSGSSGETFDKVGFLQDCLHDAAIVHHPDGTYVLTVMSTGAQRSDVAELTREWETALYGSVRDSFRRDSFICACASRGPASAPRWGCR